MDAGYGRVAEGAAFRPAVRPLREDPIATLITPRLAPACFGVACPRHGRCQRYAAVSGSAADPRTIDTCRVGDQFPLFLACVSAQSAPAGLGALAACTA